MRKKYHILIAEDLRTDAELAEREVRKVLPESVFRFVETEEEFIKELNEFNPDLIISDFKMPAFTGLRALKITLEKSYLTPLIILTGSMNEDTAVECMKAGAADYVIKEHIRRLGTAVVNALEKTKNIIERAKYQNELIKSEERFRRIAENADDLIYRYDFLPTPKFTYVSPAAYKITGYTPEEHYSDPQLGLKIVHPHDRYLLENLQTGYENLRKPIILRWIKKSGEIIWTEQKNIPILNHKGEIEAIEGIARDITERKKAEEKRINQEKLYRTLFDLSPAGIMLEDLDGNIIDCNDNYLITTGYPREELIGQNVRKIVPPEFLSDVDEHIEEIKKGKTLLFEVHTLMKDGSRRIVELHETMITFPDGNKGIIVVTNDITERKKAEETIAASEANYKYLFENNPHPMWVYELETLKFLAANDTAVNKYGYSREEFLTMTLKDIRPIYEIELLEKNITTFNNDKYQKSGPWRHQFKSGEIIFVEITSHSIEFDGKKARLVIANDITVKLHAEEALRKSEERYRKIFDDDLTGDFIATPDGTLLLGNPALAEILGYDSVDSLMELNMNDIYPSIDYREKLLNLIYEKKRLTLYEHQLKKRDGTLITVLENVIGEFNEKGELTQIKGYILDITSRKEAEENIRKLSRGVEQSPTSIIITDCNGNIEYVNPKLETVTGYKLEELIGKNPRIFNSGEKTEEDYRVMWETLISGKEWHGEFHNKTKNNELFWESASISPIFNENGKITHFIALKEDITKQKEMITELITAKDKAEEMSRVKSYFFANMSHELRTPLIGILGFSEVLQEILSTDLEKQKMAKTIHTSGLRLLETLNNILRISKIEAERVAYELQDQNIVPVLEGVVELFSKTAKEAGIKLEFTYSEESIICSTDKNLLREIMNNLVNNAIKFSEGGSVKVEVEKQEEIARINVIDQGIGIPKDKQELIWEAFRQVSEGLSRGFEGTGLGLTISKKYAELIRSKIYFKSEEGKGTTFTIELPLSNEEQILILKNKQRLLLLP